MNKNEPGLALLGWREWVGLRDLGIYTIKAKIDTGAKTSSLHTLYQTPFEEDGQLWVKFGMLPIQDESNDPIEGRARVIDQRHVKNSGGQSEFRYVIETPLTIGKLTYPIALTLTNRANMNFRMLLGRTAIQGHFYVDCQSSFLLGGDRFIPTQSSPI